MQIATANKLSESEGQWQKAYSTLGMVLGSAIIDKTVDYIVTADDFILFSFTKATWQGETKVIVFGVFGNVYISRQLDEKIIEALYEDNNQ